MFFVLPFTKWSLSLVLSRLNINLNVYENSENVVWHNVPLQQLLWTNFLNISGTHFEL